MEKIINAYFISCQLAEWEETSCEARSELKAQLNNGGYAIRQEWLYARELSPGVLRRVRRIGIFSHGLVAERVLLEQRDGNWMIIDNPTRDDWFYRRELREVHDAEGKAPIGW